MIELNWQLLPLLLLSFIMFIRLVLYMLGYGFGGKSLNWLTIIVTIVMIFYTLYGIYYLFTHVKLI